jgi:adenylate cyclase
VTVKLSELQQCFQGIVPAVIATCAADGTPNVSYLSQVHYVDESRVALSCQFFNKTRKNVDENPYASLQLYDPRTFEAYMLELRFDHAETSGPLYDSMALRIDAIASQTGMAGVFRLLSADVYEVLSLRPLPEFLDGPIEDVPAAPEPAAPRSELRALQVVCERLRGATHLEGLLGALLSALEAALGFEHSMVLLPDERGGRLFTVASRGYGEGGIGAEIALGEGLVGTVARERRALRLSATDAELRYGRAIRREAEARGSQGVSREIPLPGLPDAQSHLALPLLAQDRLVGVLAVESRRSLAFEEWHEPFLGVVAAQVAVAIENMMLRDDAEEPEPEEPAPPSVATRTRSFCFYRNDDCMFVDGEYLVRNVPGKILWKVLRQHLDAGRTSFTNRELRMDASLGLPPIKDNLESRLILLRKRLTEKCPELRLASGGRGHFRLESDCKIELLEKDSP